MSLATCFSQDMEQGWSFYTTENSELPSDHVEAIAIQDGELIWVATYGTLSSFDGDNWEVYDRSNSGILNCDIFVLAIDNDEDRTIWLGTLYYGLMSFDGTTWGLPLLSVP